MPAPGGKGVMSFRRFTMTVNDLKLPVALEIAVDTDDGAGGMTRVWVPQGGRIYVGQNVQHSTYVGQGQSLMIEDIHWVGMRYQPGITSGARWRFNSEFGIWYIKTATDPFNDKHWLLCQCTEVAS